MRYLFLILSYNSFFLITSLSQTNRINPQFYNHDFILSDFQVNELKNEDNYLSKIAVDSLGNFIIIWLSEYWPDYSEPREYRIKAQRYFADGSLIDSNFIVTDEFALINSDSYPSMAINSEGIFVVTWHDYRNGGIADIYAQWYSDKAIPMTDNIKISEGVGSIFPSVCEVIDGNFVFTWSLGKDIFARKLSSTGIPLSNVLKVNDNSTFYSEPKPSIASNVDGGYIIIWPAKSGENFNILSQLYSNDGTKLGNNFSVRNFSYCPPNGYLVVDMDNNHNSVVAWSQDRVCYELGSDIFAQRFSSDGNKLGATFKVNFDSISCYNSSISFLENGNFVIAWDINWWKDSADIFAQLYTLQGETISSNFLISDFSVHGQFLPSIKIWKNLLYTTWTDNRRDSTKWDIWANIIDLQNIVHIDNSNSDKDNLSYSLNQNYPNPFNPTTQISYSIPKQSTVSLRIFNILGKEVKTLVNEQKPSGNYKVEFDASSLPSGIYFYRLQSGDFSETKKLIILR